MPNVQNEWAERILPRASSTCLCGLLLATGCCTSEVRALTGTATSVCPGSTVGVHWEVKGRAELSAVPPPASWKDGPVSSSGTRVVTIAAPTDFTVRAPDANPAKGRASLPLHVGLLQTPAAQDRSVLSNCSADGTVEGKMTLSDVGTAQVSRIRAPLAKYGPAVQPARICVTHQGPPVCLDPGQSVDFPRPAAGDWTLRLDPAPSPACQNSPSQLRISLDFACRP